MTPVPANEPIPVMDFFRGGGLKAPKLNRSGTKVAAIVSDENNDQRLLIYDVATKKNDVCGEGNVHFFSWLSDTRILFEAGVNLYAANIDGLKDTYPLQRWGAPAVVGIPKRNPLRPLVWIRSDYYHDGQDDGVVALNTDMGDKPAMTRSSEIGVAGWAENNQRHIADAYAAPPGGLAHGYLADKEGELAFGLTSKDGVVSLHQLVDRHWQECQVDLETTDILTCGNQPGEVVVLAPGQAGKPRALQFMNAAKGDLGEVLVQDDAYDFNGALFRDRASRNIVGAVYDRSRPKVVWFSEAYRSVQKTLDGFFPGLVTRIISNDEPGRRFLVSTFSDRQPTIYYLVDLEKHSVGLFNNSRPRIDPKRMQPMNIMRYKTTDGRELDAYVTLPEAASKNNPAPLIVLPHDGPWERDTWGYDGWVQYLASHGYAVIQPNYRGSSGYNWMFPEEDKWAFLKMSGDIAAATKTLVASGLVDGSRIAVVGWGFGAFLALCGIENEPGLYRCAVVNDGIFDIAQLIKETKYYQFDSPSYGRLVRKLGDPSKEREKFEAISPVRHVDKVKNPVFVSQWKDAASPVRAQTRQLKDELEKHHVSHEFVSVDSASNKRAEFYMEIESFLERNLAAGKAPANGRTSVPKGD